MLLKLIRLLKPKNQSDPRTSLRNSSYSKSLAPTWVSVGSVSSVLARPFRRREARKTAIPIKRINRMPVRMTKVMLLSLGGSELLTS